jgi:uncharacterized UBP type Zn finger protein
MNDKQTPNQSTISRQRRSQLAAKARGECIQCFKPRGEDGTAEHCRKCADKRNRKRAAKSGLKSK